jgi:hypothetical protein
MEMKEICEDLKANVNRIVQEWYHLVHAAPWVSMPPGTSIDHLPPVVLGIAEAALCAPADMEAHRQKVWAAAKHGQDRRRQGYEEPLIFQEYHYLRQAIWNYLRQAHPESETVMKAIFRIDTAIQLAITASIQGYHREELEQQGHWPQIIETIVGDSPLLHARP